MWEIMEGLVTCLECQIIKFYQIFLDFSFKMPGISIWYKKMRPKVTGDVQTVGFVTADTMELEEAAFVR